MQTQTHAQRASRHYHAISRSFVLYLVFHLTPGRVLYISPSAAFCQHGRATICFCCATTHKWFRTVKRILGKTVRVSLMETWYCVTKTQTCTPALTLTGLSTSTDVFKCNKLQNTPKLGTFQAKRSMTRWPLVLCLLILIYMLMSSTYIVFLYEMRTSFYTWGIKEEFICACVTGWSNADQKK